MLKTKVALATAAVFMLGSYTNYVRLDKEISRENLNRDVFLSFDSTAILEAQPGGKYDPRDAVTEVSGDYFTLSCDYVDLSTVGTTFVKYSVTSSDRYNQVVTKEYTRKFHVIDSIDPVITLESESISIFTKETVDLYANIVSVDDEGFGPLVQMETLDRGGYVAETDLNNAKAGTYTVTIKAMDTNGNTSEAFYQIKVTKKVDLVPGVDYTYKGQKLTKRNGTIYGPSGKETYYNLKMDGVVRIMRRKGFSEEKYPYWIREDGCKMLGDYIMVAANLQVHPRGTLVETSLGTGLVCDTGAFSHKNTHQIDIAVNW